MSKLMVALDFGNEDRLVPATQRACAFVNELGDEQKYYKVGLGLLLNDFSIIDWLVLHQKVVMVDLKLWDIPSRIRAVVRMIKKTGASFLTVMNDPEYLIPAVEEAGDTDLLVVAVSSILSSTSVPQQAEFPRHLIQRAEHAGASGIVIPAGFMRDSRVPATELLTFATGCRGADTVTGDDQRLVGDGDMADFRIVGRPIMDQYEETLESYRVKFVRKSAA